MLKIGLKQIKQLVEKWDKTNLGKRFDFYPIFLLNQINENAKPWKLNMIILNRLDDTIVQIHSIVGKHSSKDKRVKSPEFSTGMVNIKPRKEGAPFYDLVAIVDPLTRQTQKISTILRTLTEVANVNLVIYFNCKEKLSAPPLKRWKIFSILNIKPFFCHRLNIL